MLESELIRKAQKGDREAQKQLYNANCRKWFAICLRYNRNRMDAEDVLQNGLVKIFGNLHQFNSELVSFGAWTARIIANENIQFIKSKMSVVGLEEVPDVVNVETANAMLEKLSEAALVKLIQKLPLGYRTVFNLYVLEGYSHAEISQILGISIGTSKSQLSKSKSMLRQKIELLL